jgi:protein-disulfide isomerase
MYSPYYPPPPPPPPSRTPWVAIIIVTTVLLGGVMVVGALGFFFAVRSHRHASLGGGSLSTTSSSSKWSDWDSPIPVSSDDPTWGDREAPVTVVVFADLEDPFAARVGPTLDTLKSLYGEPKLRIAWKHHIEPWHTHARDAAEASAGVFALGGRAAFWHFEERAFANQSSLDALSFATWAAESGVDTTKLRAGTARHEWAPKVDDDEKLAKTLGVFSLVAYVNGVRVLGSTSMPSWQKTIDDELPLAESALSSGVPGDRIYVTRSKLNFASGTAAAAPTTTYAPPSSPLTVHAALVGSSPVRGPNDALVTIVEFSDFQCPYCKRSEDTLRSLRTKYGSDLRIVWKNEPLAFHTHAEPAAELALEARAEKGDSTFWMVHDDLYTSSPSLDTSDLLRIARARGLDETRVRNAITTHAYQTTINTDQTLSKKLSATGTPTFFINGRTLTGAQPQASFEVVIDDELAKAKARVAKGTARAKVYDEIMATAITE